MLRFRLQPSICGLRSAACCEIKNDEAQKCRASQGLRFCFKHGGARLSSQVSDATIDVESTRGCLAPSLPELV